MLPTTRFRRNPDVIAAEAIRETVLLHPGTWTYASFNETGAWLWDCLEQPRTFEWFVSAAQQNFEVGAADIRVQLEEFLHHVAAKQLVIVEDSA